MEKVFFERINKINPKILEGLKEKKEFSFRINRHKAGLEAIEELKKEGYEPKRVEWSEWVYTLPMSDRKKITKIKTLYLKQNLYSKSLFNNSGKRS